MGGFFKDGDGQLSATRLAFLAWAFGVLIGWFLVLIRSEVNALPKIDPSITYTLALLIAGKVVQSFSPGDQKLPDPTQTVTTTTTTKGPAPAAANPGAGAGPAG